MVRLLNILIFFFILTIQAYASAPVIYYSDLTSGPQTGGQNNKGVFVTIWGNNFGASQGGSTVAINGGNVDNYPTWTNTMICFQLGSSPSTGNIVVTVGGVASNGIPFTIRTGNIYFVNPAAGTNGSGTYASPYNNLNSAYSVAVAGDTTYVLAGSFTDTSVGSGYGAILTSQIDGTSGSPIAWVAYPNATVTLTADTGNIGNGSIVTIFKSYSGGAYQVVSKFYMVDTNPSTHSGNTAVITWTGWRVIGNHITSHNAQYAAGIDIGGLNVEVLGNEVYSSYNDTYNNQAHSIYIDGTNGNGNITNFEVGWNYMHGNYNQGWEIDAYHNGPRTGTVHDNLIIADHGSGSVKGILVDGGAYDGGDTLSTTYNDNEKVYNNILVNVGLSNSGDDGVFETTCGTAYIYNNTIYGNGTNTSGVMSFPDGACGPSGGTPVMYVANNIIYQTDSSLYISNGNGSAPPWSQFTLLSNNIYYGNGNGPSQDSHPINSDPKLVSPTTDTSGNWSIQSSSPAIGAGYNTNSIVANDYNGVTRPNPPAIGAYEYGTSGGGGSGSSTITGQWVGKLVGTLN